MLIIFWSSRSSDCAGCDVGSGIGLDSNVAMALWVLLYRNKSREVPAVRRVNDDKNCHSLQVRYIILIRKDWSSHTVAYLGGGGYATAPFGLAMIF